MEKGWQRIYSSDRPHLIEIVKAVLKDNQIEVIMMDKRDSTNIMMNELELYVKDNDVVLAKFLITKNEL